eukprot:GHRR01030376.1.p3 GENE.GHRR01030376.1~~GHRR01030376.1.p3  ORF type:complete len:100 (-),score=19.58 GHRR01030376.1:1019-1318(-)
MSAIFMSGDRACNQVVSLHCNLDATTKHLINKERLQLMKPDAVLINAARGSCIDEAALVQHLQANPNFRAGVPGCCCVYSAVVASLGQSVALRCTQVHS